MGEEKNTCSEPCAEPYNPLSPLRMIRPDLIGFVFHLSWLYLLFYSSAISAGSPVGGPSSTDAMYVSSALVLAFVLGIGSVRTKQFMCIWESRAGSLIAPAITAFGTLLYCLNQSAPSPLLVWTAGALTGIGSAALAARWASVFGNTSSRVIIANSPTILAIIVAICLSIDYLPYELCLALIVVLPLCSGAALQFARRYQHELDSKHERTRKPLADPSHTTHCVPLVILVGLIGFTVALLPSFDIAGANYGMLFYLISAVLVLGFFGTVIFLADRRTLFVLFVIPLTVLALVIVPFAQYAATSLEDAFYPVGNIAFELMLVLGTVLFALQTNQSPAKTFMVGRTTLAVFDFAGAYLGERIASTGSDTVLIQLASICLFASSELLIVALVVSYFANRRGRKGASNACNVAASTNAPNRADIIVDDAGEIDQERQFRKLAENLGLSEREQDVFVLLAEGRSSARIQEDLCIAAGTVNYHTRNIYQKLDVHSRQEIIDLAHSKVPATRTER